MQIPVVSDWLDRWAERRQKSTLKNPARWLVETLGGEPTYTGRSVTEETAMKSTAVLACVRILAESVAMLPLMVYRRQERGKERARGHPLYEVLHDRPNPQLSSFQWRETMMMHLLLWGNAYCEIEYRGDGQIRALWPLLPHETEVHRDDDNPRELWYYTYLPDGQFTVFPSRKVLHIAGLAYNGRTGLSPIGYARESIGLDLATEEFGARFFGQGANMGVVAKHPGQLSDNAYKRLKKDLEEKHTGLGKAHRLMLLEEGMDIDKVGIPPENAQFLETRQFQKRDIARVFRVPLYLLADVEKGASYSSIEQQSLDFLKYSVQPWLTRMEQSLTNQLLSDEARRRYFVEFLIDSLLRADIQTRYQAYSTGINYGFLTINEVRSMENLNPSDAPEADTHFIQQNMQRIDMAGMPDMRKQIIANAQGRAPAVGERRGGRERLERVRRREREVRERAARLVRWEREAILDKAKDYLERSRTSFLAWLERFYEDEFKGEIKSEMRPAFRRLAEDMRDDLGDELDIDKALSESDEEFLEEYLEAYSARYADSSQGQLAHVLGQAAESDKEEYELLEERLDEWEERRPNKEARNETRQLGNAIARAIMVGAGVQYLRWSAAGGDTCPFCQELDGTIVGIDQPFVGDGDRLQAEDEDHDMEVYRPSFHPPIHQFCQCQIEPHMG